jgi:hypothetical protein
LQIKDLQALKQSNAVKKDIFVGGDVRRLKTDFGKSEPRYLGSYNHTEMDGPEFMGIGF